MPTLYTYSDISDFDVNIVKDWTRENTDILFISLIKTCYVLIKMTKLLITIHDFQIKISNLLNKISNLLL